MGLRQLDKVYSEAILDHCRNPRNGEKLEEADITADGVNPFCGDEIHVQISLGRESRTTGIGLQGVGCSINKAAGSMLTESIIGKTPQEVERVSVLFRRMMGGEVLSENELDELGGLQELAGVRQFPVRIKCALLAWSTLEEGIETYHRDHAD